MRWLSRRAHRKARSIRAVGSLQVGDPRFDDWEVVRDFEDLKTALAWRQHLSDASIEAVITSDWPLDRFERGDIALRVPPGSWSEAEELLGQLDEEDW